MRRMRRRRGVWRPAPGPSTSTAAGAARPPGSLGVHLRAGCAPLRLCRGHVERGLHAGRAAAAPAAAARRLRGQAAAAHLRAPRHAARAHLARPRGAPPLRQVRAARSALQRAARALCAPAA
eukprot:7381344-Prymnesium_polylepis.1